MNATYPYSSGAADTVLSAPTSPSSPTSTTLPAPPASKSHIRAIAGGAAGGASLLFLLFLALWCSRKRQRQSRNSHPVPILAARKLQDLQTHFEPEMQTREYSAFSPKHIQPSLYDEAYSPARQTFGGVPYSPDAAYISYGKSDSRAASISMSSNSIESNYRRDSLWSHS